MMNPNQQYPEHILKQADEMTKELAAEIYTIYENETDHECTCLIEPERACAFCNGWGKAKKKSLEEIRDTLNLPALLMAREENKQLELKVQSAIGTLMRHGFTNAAVEIIEHMPVVAAKLTTLQEQLTQHQQVVKQLAAALYKQLPISENLSEVKWDAIKAYEALSTAKTTLGE